MPATSLPRRPRWGRRIGLAIGALLLALVLLVVIDVVLVASRMTRHEVELPTTPGPQTWVILGLDNRVDVEAELGGYLGSPDEQPGTRADVIIVVTQMEDAIRGLSIPRNLMVDATAFDRGRGRDRLATMWISSPQVFVNVMCTEINIPIDHLVTIDLQAFVTIVDALGGIEIDVPAPLWDGSRLEVYPGVQTMDGITALAYVRSRLGATVIDGVWVPEPNGEAARQQRQAAVVDAILAKAMAHPELLQRAAWQASPHIGLDEGTSLLDLLALKDLEGIQTMPTVPLAGGKLDEMDFTSQRAVAERGYTSQCQVDG